MSSTPCSSATPTVWILLVAIKLFAARTEATARISAAPGLAGKRSTFPTQKVKPGLGAPTPPNPPAIPSGFINAHRAHIHFGFGRATSPVKPVRDNKCAAVRPTEMLEGRTDIEG